MTDGPTSAVDLQDPLPESSWFWRRVFVFTVTGVVLFFLWGAIDRLGSVAVLSPRDGVPALLELCKWIIVLTILMATYYMIAPSAEQIVKLFKVAALLKSGVQTAGRQVIHGDDSDTVKTAGRPVPDSPTMPSPPTQGSGADTSLRQAVSGPPWDVPTR